MRIAPFRSDAEAYFLCGIPDSGQKPILVTSNGRNLSYIFQGTANFINSLPEPLKSYPRLYLPMQKGTSLSVIPKPFINHIGDPDFYHLAIIEAMRVVNQFNVPCFNHPSAIRRMTRDQIPTIVGDITGIIAPRTIKFRPIFPHDFVETAKSNNLRYPIIARLSGTHGGRSQILILDQNDWSKIFSIPWINEYVYLTEFYDYRDPDGYYRKQRVAVIKDQIIPRHGVANYTWSVSGNDSPPETLESEVLWSKNFERDTLPVIKERILKISEKLQIDYFGVDYSLRPNEDILIFEVSSSMSMTGAYNHQSHAQIEHFPAFIRETLAELLRKPSSWACNKVN